MFIFGFIFITLGNGSKKILLRFMSKSVLLMFSSKSFTVSGLVNGFFCSTKAIKFDVPLVYFLCMVLGSVLISFFYM